MTTIFRMALERAGFDVDTFNNPVLALRNFRPKLYDLVILDIIMPRMDGFELYKQIKKVDPDVLVCFLTASEKCRQEVRNEEYCALNKDLFFQKPISIKDLIREVDKRIKSA
jgi:DNA-binding response OmpR family regulator